MSAGPRLPKWLFLSAFLIACCLMAQRLISFRKISVNDGLSQSTTTYLMQDSRGYIWISTDDGLNRYDGYTFTVFRPDPGNPYSIADTKDGMLVEDSAQNIWICSSTGINKYDPRTNRFFAWHHDDKNPHSLAKGNVTGICFDPDQQLWIAATSGLDIKQPQSDSFEHLTTADGLPSSHVNGVVMQDKQLLVATDSGLCWVDFTTKMIQPCIDTMIHDCHRVLRDKSGDVFVIADTSMYRFNRGTGHFVCIASGLSKGSRDNYNAGGITAIAESNDHVMWSGGWMSLSASAITDSSIVHQSWFSNGVWPGGSAAICVDKGQNVWAGGEGLELTTGNMVSSRFLSYRITYAGQPAQVNNPVWSCNEDAAGNFWICTQASINRVNPQTGEVKLYRNDPVDKNSIYGKGGSFCALSDHNGVMWIDCDLGLCRYNPASDNFTNYVHLDGDTFSHPPRNVSAMLETREGDLWLGMYGYNLVKFDRAAGKFYPYRQPKGTEFAPSATVIRSLFQDNEGTIWVGTAKGLDRFDPATGKYYRMFDSPDNSKFSSEIMAIEQAETGFLWIGSGALGLLKYDIAHNKIVKQYTEKDGLANNTIYEVVPDNNGILWIATNHGLSRFEPTSETFRNYDHSDGIQNNEFSGNAGTFTPSGWMLFGTADGFTAFRPDDMNENPYPPQVLITHLKLFNKDVAIQPDAGGTDSSGRVPVYSIMQSDQGPVLPIDISFVKSLELDYDENFLSFDFVGMHYASPEKNQYAYMMEGLDTKWNECGTQRSATYTNIPPGHYTFYVKAANCDGVWNNQGALIYITVNPPWWATWWFRTLAVLSVAAAIVGYFRYRTASLRKRQKELEQTVRERTAEVVAQKEEITVQKHMVEEKQKEIIDSINYAQRIQRALLASDKLLKENLGEHFVLFKPKDIVAGDFYWGTATDNGFMLITADCTGHGVPGAFMSLLNISKLSETIAEKKITRPDLVLNNVRAEIIRSLNPNAGDNSQDGMDCILCNIDLKNRKLQYAAANNSFYIVRNRELIICEADKMPVGKAHDDTKPFTLHTVDLLPGDVIYTLTDGYPDQFGGPKGKKFKYKQLEELLLSISAEPMHLQKQKLEEALVAWRGNLEQVDDICIVGIKIA